MTYVEYLYTPAVEPLTEVWFKMLETVDGGGEFGGDMYWLTQGGTSGNTLLELSTDGKRYRYAWWNGKAGRGFDTGRGTSPLLKWLNPDALVHRDKQPLPFSWRS